jgi:hypothetical protein
MSKNIGSLAWLAPRDLLLVFGIGNRDPDYETETENRLYRYFMVDATTDTLINKFEFEVSVPFIETEFAWYSQNIFTQWHEETEQLIIAYIDPAPRILRVHFLGLDGTISTRQYSLPESEVFNIQLFPDAGLLYPNVDEFSEYVMVNLIDDTTHEYHLEAPASITQLGDLPYVLIKDAVRESGLESYQWDEAKYFLLDLRDFSMTWLGTFPLRSTFRWSEDGQIIVFDIGSTLYVYDVKDDRFHERPLFFDPRYQTSARYFRIHQETGEMYILNPEVGENGESQDKLYVYDLTSGSVTKRFELPFFRDFSSFSPDFDFYLNYQRIDDEISLIISSLDNTYQLPLPFSPRNPVLDMVASLNWYEDGNWFLIYEAYMGDGGASFTRWSGVANMDGYKRDLSYCVGCVTWLPEHIDINKLSEGQPTSVLPAITSEIEVPGDDDILWHDDYFSVDDVTYNIETGDIVSLPDYDISFEASENTLFTFEGLAYRIEEIYDGATFMAVIEQSSNDITGRYVYRESTSDPGKFVTSRNIFIQPTDRVNGLLVIWDMERGEISSNLPIPALRISVSPDEEHVAFQMAHNKVQVWSVDELLELGLVVPPREVPLDYDFELE